MCEYLDYSCLASEETYFSVMILDRGLYQGGTLELTRIFEDEDNNEEDSDDSDEEDGKGCGNESCKGIHVKMYWSKNQ